MSKLAEAALAYAVRGWAVFPLRPRSKTPIMKGSFHNASTDLEQVESWWKMHPDANIALACGKVSGFTVLDVDGPSGLDSLEDLTATHGPLPDTPQVITGHGWHHYLRYSGQGRQIKFRPGLDCLGDGGYVIAPPSIHPDTRRSYDWELTLNLDHPLADWPDWLLSPVAATNAHANGNLLQFDASLVPYLDEEAPCTEGSRNNTLAQLVGRWIREQKPMAAIFDSARRWNARCQPPLGEFELMRTVESVIRTASNHGDSITILPLSNDPSVQEEDDEEEGETEGVGVESEPSLLSDDLLTVPGFIGEFMAICMEQSPSPNKHIALGAGLALLGTMSGRRIADESDGRTNPYFCVLAPSGGGKDFPRSVIKKALAEIDRLGVVLESIASAEALQDALKANPWALALLDELDSFLESAGKQPDGRHGHLLAELLKLFSSARLPYVTRRLAKSDTPPAIDQPHVCLAATATPARFFATLNESMIVRGLAGRLLVVEAGESEWIPDLMSRGRITIPDSFLDKLRAWDAVPCSPGNLSDVNRVGVNLPGVPITTKVVTTTHAASNVFRDAREAFHARYQEAVKANDEVGTALWARAFEHCRKLALIYTASLDGPEASEIPAEAATWAARFVKSVTIRFRWQIKRHTADGWFAQIAKKAIRALQESGGKMTHSRLLRKLDIDADTFRKLITTMQSRGDILYADRKTAGRTAKDVILRKRNI